MALTETTYKIDREDCIIDVSSGWDGFAIENNGPSVVSSSVIGHKLSEFISGDSTSMWIYSLIHSARATKKEIVRFYRCDSPEEKRYMKMTITPEEDGSVSVTSKLLRTEKMRRRVPFVYNPGSSNRKCSICNRIQYQNSWLEPDDARVLGLLDDSDPISVIYSVCPTCMQKNLLEQ